VKLKSNLYLLSLAFIFSLLSSGVIGARISPDREYPGPSLGRVPVKIMTTMRFGASAWKKGLPLRIGDLIEKQKREIIFKATWGSGADQLGCLQEASPEAPQSFAIDCSGTLLSQTF
jgi:hypothetical protein